jgi:hypothetical protein
MSKHLRLEHKFVWYYFTLNKINIVIIFLKSLQVVKLRYKERINK